MSIPDDLRIGVIGAGGRGRLARHSHKPGEGSRLVAGCDIVPAALESFREFAGDDVFTCEDYRELLDRDDIDAVFVTTPDYWHEEHALAALDAGKAVYLEKPMTITIDGCDRVLRKAHEKGVKLYLGHNMRHMSFVQKMKELIDSGAIGEVKAGWCRHFVAYGGDAYFKDWHADRSKATSMLLQKGAHDIDVLHWLCGGYSKRVTGFGNLSVYNQIQDRHDPAERGDASWHLENWPPLSQTGMNPVLDVEDLSMIMMDLDNGVLASYQQCHYSPDGWRNYTIIGTEGRIENFGDAPGNCVVRLWNKRYHYKPEGDVEFPIAPVTGGHGGADPAIVGEFVRYVREGGSIKTSPVAARNSVAAGCAGAASLRQGGMPLSIPPLDPELIRYFEQHVE
ncbi:MAG: Gfo/Idh/MocA family oxidoreductase [Victivallales bacterium]|jgi:predicted dehydrogenase|nr:Gfo/Idh/MocA family oxidoreductase [Victivallales bacterium]MBT7301607.1 Gfo/Idh/MocA family oxidoreductase [Victivallales bacterium]